MTLTPRLLQNFKGSRALIIAARGLKPVFDNTVENALENTLTKLGVTSQYLPIIDGRAQIEVDDLQPDRDILFIDGDLEGVAAIKVDPATRLPPAPVIGLVGVEAPSRLKALVNLGATAFLRKPVHGGAVYASLFMGVNQFLLRTDLGDRVQNLEARRRNRRAIVRATILLMQQHGLSEEDAYSRLRRESMRARQSLELYCEDFLNGGAAIGREAIINQQSGRL